MACAIKCLWARAQQPPPEHARERGGGLTSGGWCGMYAWVVVGALCNGVYRSRRSNLGSCGSRGTFIQAPGRDVLLSTGTSTRCAACSTPGEKKFYFFSFLLFIHGIHGTSSWRRFRPWPAKPFVPAASSLVPAGRGNLCEKRAVVEHSSTRDS